VVKENVVKVSAGVKKHKYQGLKLV